MANLKSISLCLLLFAFVNANAQDSTGKVNMVYASLEVNVSQKLGGYTTDDKYFNPKIHSLQWAAYNFKSPQIGIGFLHKKRLVLKSDLAFWYGSKKTNSSSYYLSESIDGVQLFNQNSGSYYTVNERIESKTSFYNLDWNLSVGASLGKSLSLLVGFRNTFLLSYSINGELTRQGDYYANGSSEPHYSYATRYLNNDLKSKNRQELNNLHYLTLSLLYNDKIKERPFFFELQTSYPGHKQVAANATIFSLKAGISIFK